MGKLIISDKELKPCIKYTQYKPNIKTDTKRLLCNLKGYMLVLSSREINPPSTLKETKTMHKIYTIQAEHKNGHKAVIDIATSESRVYSLAMKYQKAYGVNWTITIKG